MNLKRFWSAGEQKLTGSLKNMVFPERKTIKHAHLMEIGTAAAFRASPFRKLWQTAIAISFLALASCEREDRRPKLTPWVVSPVQMEPRSDPTPGAAPAVPVTNRYEKNAVSLTDGKRIYMWFNCAGCHANGGGGMGPALMDAQWIYGSAPEQVVESIWKGRPNGMPSFAGKIPDYQVWQVAAYVRSMSGQVSGDAATSRSDHMAVKPPESRMPEQTPVRLPAAEERR